MATLVTKGGGSLLASPGEVELVSLRTETSKTFDLGGGRRRLCVCAAPVHYRADPFNAVEALKEIDLDVALTPGLGWDAASETNGHQVRFWQSLAQGSQPSQGAQTFHCVAQYRRAGSWLTMAPVALHWANDAGQTQLIGVPSKPGAPVIDNDAGFVTWQDAFGKGLHFRYVLRADEFYKALVIESKEALPTATIGAAGLRLELVMALAWNGAAPSSGFAAAKAPATLAGSLSDVAAPDERSDVAAKLDFRDAQARPIWWLREPRAWDSADPHPHTAPVAFTLARRDTATFGVFALDAKTLNQATYPVYMDGTISDLSVAAGANDGMRQTGSADTWDTAGSNLEFGKYVSGGTTYYYDTWARFPNAYLPPGVTITAAQVEFYAYGNAAGNTCNVTIKVEDVDSATQFGSKEAYDAAVWSGTTVPWNAVSAWTTSTWYQSPDIAALIAVPFARPGWARFNAVGLAFKDNGSSANAWRKPRSYDGASAFAPRLDVTYTANTATYSANASDGVKGYNTARPPASRTGWTSASATDATDKSKLNAADATLLQINAPEPVSLFRYPGACAHWQIAEARDSIFKLTMRAKGYGVRNAGPPSYGFYFYAWNYSTGAYDLLGSHTTVTSTAYAVEKTANADIQKYIDATGNITLAAFGPASDEDYDADVFVDLLQAEVEYVQGVIQGAGTVTAQSSVSGSAKRTRTAAGAVTAQSSVSGLAQCTHRAAGAVAVQSAVTGSAIYLTQGGSGQVAAQSAVAGSGIKVKFGQGQVGAGSAVSTSALVTRSAGGTVAAQAAVAAAATRMRNAAGTAQGVATVTANATGGKTPAEGRCHAVGRANCMAVVTRTTSGAVAAVSSVTASGLLNVTLGAGQVVAQSSVTASALVTRSAGGTVIVQSAVSVVAQKFIMAAGVVAAVSNVQATALVILRPYLSLTASGRPVITWEKAGTAHVLLDGVLSGVTNDRRFVLPDGTDVREYLLIATEMPDAPQTPMDRVLLTWDRPANAVGFKLYRRPASSSQWTEIADVEAETYTDGALADATWRYKVVAYDEEGDISPASPVRSLTIESAPEPPSGLDYSWDPNLKRMTLTWNTSPAADLAGYRVYSSEGDPEIDLAAEPYGAVGAGATQWQRDFTTESGTYLFLVRAYDATGHEDGNLTQVVQVNLSAGDLVSLPAEPRIVEARAVAGGKIEVEWLYVPRDEEDGPGVAQEARIYWDAGTGTVDFTTLHATVAMGHPTATVRYTWTSAALTNDQEYRFVVRIATAAWPDGVETQNVDEHAATADADQPAAPALELELL